MFEAQQAFRRLVLAALRDGRVKVDQIAGLAPESAEIDDPEVRQSEAHLRLVLGDLGVVIDEDLDAPDVLLEPDEEDEEKFGDEVTEAFGFLQRLQSDDADPSSLYVKSPLPTDRLTRDEEIALGIAIEEGMLDVLVVVSESPAVIAKLLADADAVRRGEIPTQAMFDAAAALRDEEPSEEEADDDVPIQDHSDTVIHTFPGFLRRPQTI